MNPLNNIPKSTKYKYIICPDMNCGGFYNKFMQCEVSKTTIELFPKDNFKICPYVDKALKVVFCHYGHPIEGTVNCSDWQRADCECGSCSFSRMSDTTYRIPLERYEEFKNKQLTHD